MSRYFFIILILFSACKLTTENAKISSEMVLTGHEDGPVAKAVFVEDVYKFGTISQGQLVDFTFRFKNEGDIPLVIASMKPACGCTLVDGWPTAPIAPGDSAEIPVQFNSADKQGHISKSITMVANTEPKTTVLYFEGEVIAPESN